MNGKMGSGGMGSQGMGAGTSKSVPPLKRYRCLKCGKPYLHRAQDQVTCPHCRNVQGGHETGMEEIK